MNVNQGATYQQHRPYAPPDDRIPRRPEGPAANVGHAPLSSLASTERARNPQPPQRPAQQQSPNDTRQRVPISALPRSNPGPESNRSRDAASGSRPVSAQVRNDLYRSVGSTRSERDTSQGREAGRQVDANGQRGPRPSSLATGSNAVGQQTESRQEASHQRRPSLGANTSQTTRTDQRVPQSAVASNAARTQDVAAINRQYNSTNAVNQPGPSGRMRTSTSEQRTEDNRLAGQQIKHEGLMQLIKPYPKTKQALLDDKPEDAFAWKDASDHIDDTDPEAEAFARTSNVRTYLEVYFPWRTPKFDQHPSKDCRGLCNGGPHPNKQIVCRFCKKPLEPERHDHERYDHRKALHHLENEGTSCTVPSAERKLLSEGFRKADAKAFELLKLVLSDPPNWIANLSFRSIRSSRPPAQTHRARPSTAVAAGSSSSSAPRRAHNDGQRQRPQQQQATAVQPIPAKAAAGNSEALQISPTRIQAPRLQASRIGLHAVDRPPSQTASGSKSSERVVQTASVADQSMDSIQEEEEEDKHDQYDVDNGAPETWGVTTAGDNSGREAVSDAEEDELAEEDAFIYEPLLPQEPGTPPLRPTDFQHLQPVVQVTSKPAEQKVEKDVLDGQTVSVAGFKRPIRPYRTTLELIRQDDAMSPFEVREATEYTNHSLILRKKTQRTYLEVYFPWREARGQEHDPAVCGNVCSGQPHFYDGPICRFCKKGLELNQTVQQSQLDLLVALNHLRLQGKCKRLPENEKALLVQAIERWDADVLNAKRDQQRRKREKIEQQAKHLRETSAQAAATADRHRGTATQTDGKAADPDLAEEEEDPAQHTRANHPSILPTPEPSDSSPQSPRVIRDQRKAQLAEPFQPPAVPPIEQPRERKSSAWNLDAQGLLNSVRNASIPARTASPVAREPVKPVQQTPTELSMEEVTSQAAARVREMMLAEAAKRAAAEAASSAQDHVEETDDEQQPEMREWPTFTDTAIVSRPPAKFSQKPPFQVAGPASKLFKSSSPPEPDVTVKVEEVSDIVGTTGQFSARSDVPLHMPSIHEEIARAINARQLDDFQGGIDAPPNDGYISSDSEGTEALIEQRLVGASPAGDGVQVKQTNNRNSKKGKSAPDKLPKSKGTKSGKKTKTTKHIELSATLFPEVVIDKPKSKESSKGKEKKAKKADKKEKDEIEAESAKRVKKDKINSKGKGKAKAVSPSPPPPALTSKSSREEEEEEREQAGGNTTDDSRYGTGSDSDSSTLYVTAVAAPKSKIIRSRPSTGHRHSSKLDSKPKKKTSNKSKGWTVPTRVSHDVESDSSSSPPPRSQGRKSGLSFIKFGGDQLSSRPKSLKRKVDGYLSNGSSSESSFIVEDNEEKKMHGTYRVGKFEDEEESSSASEEELAVPLKKAPTTRTGSTSVKSSPKPAFTRSVINATSGSLLGRYSKKRDVPESGSDSGEELMDRPNKKARKVETRAAVNSDSDTSSDEDLPLLLSARASQSSRPPGTARKLVKAGDLDARPKSRKADSSKTPIESPRITAKPKERVKPKDRPRPAPSGAAAARLREIQRKREAAAESTSSGSEAEEIPRKHEAQAMHRSPSSADPLQLESPPRQVISRNAQAGTSSIEPATSERKPDISKDVIELSSSPEPPQASMSRSASSIDKLPEYLQEWEKVFLRSKLGTVDKIRKTIGSKANISGFVEHLVAQCKNDKDLELREFADDWGGLFQFKVALGQLFA